MSPDQHVLSICDKIRKLIVARRREEVKDPMASFHEYDLFTVISSVIVVAPKIDIYLVVDFLEILSMYKFSHFTDNLTKQEAVKEYWGSWMTFFYFLDGLADGLLTLRRANVDLVAYAFELIRDCCQEVETSIVRIMLRNRIWAMACMDLTYKTFPPIAKQILNEFDHLNHIYKASARSFAKTNQPSLELTEKLRQDLAKADLQVKALTQRLFFQVSDRIYGRGYQDFIAYENFTTGRHIKIFVEIVNRARYDIRINRLALERK